MARSLPRITALTLLVLQLSDTLRLSLGFAADAETAGIAIAIVDFTYVDTSSARCSTSGAEHEVRLVCLS